MRIPLDYYQILGVPENNLSELEQAYRDRLQQLPRQGYSDAAIESRKQLITVAYQVLSDSQRREEYEAEQILPAVIGREETAASGNLQPSPFHRRPELEIAPEHFLGGLLILFERGEYEEINSICMPYLGNNGKSSNSGSLHPHPLMPLSPSGNLQRDLSSRIEPVVVAKLRHTATGNYVIPLKPDIVLTMAFSFLELGDREWRDACYEAAVIHFETVQKILVHEDLFPQIQGQIDRRLDRLRPYRVSYLVALPLNRHEQRRQGIQFLEELLESACINEVQCQERFGLSGERTIQFIHETLPDLTAAEQRNLFSQLARDSHQTGTNPLNVMQLACTYLHVHALIAQGFAYRTPKLIYTAQQILLYRLSQRLDVTIEQAICALLLGQTEEANQILTTASESAALVVIRQQSQGLPNLLRGLCWYIESWLKDEAFPCFRDLETSDPSLNAYFNDPDVQDFADRACAVLAGQTSAADTSIVGWATSSPQLIDVPPSGDLSPSGSLTQPGNATLPATSENLRPYSVNTAWQSPDNKLGSGNVPAAERVFHNPPPPPQPTASEQEETSNNVIQLERERQRRRPSAPTARTIAGQVEETYLENSQQTALSRGTTAQLVPTDKGGRLVQSNHGSGTLVRRRGQRRRPNIPRILLVGTGGLTCLWGAIWLANAAVRSLTGSVTKPNITHSPSPTPRKVERDRLPGAQSPTSPPKPAIVGLLTNDVAKQIVETWLSAKAKSLSPEHQIAALKDILVEPALSTAVDRAQSARVNGVYWQYQHQVAVASIAQITPLAKVATIQAQVQEDANYYQDDRLNTNRSYSKKLLVEYNLIRQQDRWYVKDMDVIN